MGLSGRKSKQRISADPRNLAWADDAAKFGQAYLSKLGWDPTQGLGLTGDGRTSHIKVAHKLGMLGIGAQHTRDPDGIAWKQNKEFEDVLRRLNTAAVVEDGKREKSTQQIEGEDKEGSLDNGETEKKKRKQEKKRKSKERADTLPEVEEVRKKKKSRKIETTEDPTEPSTMFPQTIQITETKPPPTQRLRAHRKRFMASKDLSSKSATSISEILGISASFSDTTTTPSTPQPLTDLPLAVSEATGLDVLTTSTQSVGDYFKALLESRAKADPPSGRNLAHDNSDETQLECSEELRYDDDETEKPRGGIGSFQST